MFFQNLNLGTRYFQLKHLLSITKILLINRRASCSKKKPLDLIDPKSPVSGGYTRGPLAIMVTDDLVVTPMSSIDCISYLERMKVPLNDVEEIVINIGQREVKRSVLIFILIFLILDS
jgi:hypothetical protein